MRGDKFSDINKEWIDNLPKTINSNGCWIPKLKSYKTGYVPIKIDNNLFVLSRLSMCIYYNIDYYNKKIDTRHDTGCDKACFWYEHLKPGTTGDNVRDSVKDKTHVEARKEFCPKCGGPYTIKIIQTGWTRGKIQRICRSCRYLNDLSRKEK